MADPIHAESDQALSRCPGGTPEPLGQAPLLIDAKAAASMLALGARTLWALTKCDAVPSRRIGRAVRYCPAELRGWVAAGCPTEPGSAERVRQNMNRGVS